MESLIGKTLKNRYRVDEFLGRGGMADVYKVWDEERAVYLAMKVLRQDLAQDPIFLRRFQREAKALAALQHPHIVRFYGLERDDLLAFLLMEYVDGVSLQAEILRSEGKPLPMKHVQEVMEAVCSALHYAHHQGLVHCDIKPGNILIDKHGQIYLTDFGIARGMDAATSTMVGIGTPAYMAPELIKGQDPTPQTDIYALGIVLYEMLTGGERPFTGERATITGTTADKVRWEHLELEPTPVSQFNPKVKENIQEIIDRCLQKDPSSRFEDVIQVQNILIKSQVSFSTNARNKKTEKDNLSDHKMEIPDSVVYLGDDSITNDVNNETGEQKNNFQRKEKVHGLRLEISLFLEKLKKYPRLEKTIKIVLVVETILLFVWERGGVLLLLCPIISLSLFLLNKALRTEKGTSHPAFYWGLFIFFQPLLLIVLLVISYLLYPFYKFPCGFTIGLGLGEWIYGNSYDLSDNKKKGGQLILTGFVCIVCSVWIMWGLFYWSENTILILEIVVCLLIYGIHYLKLRNKESNKS